MTNYFQNGTATVGQKDVAFTPRLIHDQYRMYVPASFVEDKNLVSNYTYLFSKDKSPLSIAIKFTPTASEDDELKHITLYFNQAPETLHSDEQEASGIHYRETVTESKYLSVYSLRFVVNVKGGLLFGCFNCSAEYKDDWHPVVIEMLKNVESL